MNAYIARVNEILRRWGALETTTHPWFRGHRLSSWRLLPGLYRGKVDPTLERELVRDFRLKAGPYLRSGATQLEPSTFEWLFVMQHHGVSTRLLDWTENHLHGLYFAVSDYGGKADACVWVLDPWALNQETLGHQSVPTYSDPELRGYELDRSSRKVQAELPVAIRPKHATARIVAQSGVFTVHGWRRIGLEKVLTESLEKIVVSGAAKLPLLRELHRAGVTGSRVFPDLDGLAGELSFRYSKAYFAPEPVKRGARVVRDRPQRTMKGPRVKRTKVKRTKVKRTKVKRTKVKRTKVKVSKPGPARSARRARPIGSALAPHEPRAPDLEIPTGPGQSEEP